MNVGFYNLQLYIKLQFKEILTQYFQITPLAPHCNDFVDYDGVNISSHQPSVIYKEVRPSQATRMALNLEAKGEKKCLLLQIYSS